MLSKGGPRCCHSVPWRWGPCRVLWHWLCLAQLWGHDCFLDFKEWGHLAEPGVQDLNLGELWALDSSPEESQGQDANRELLQGHPTEPWWRGCHASGPVRQGIKTKRIILEPYCLMLFALLGFRFTWDLSLLASFRISPFWNDNVYPIPTSPLCFGSSCFVSSVHR